MIIKILQILVGNVSFKDQSFYEFVESVLCESKNNVFKFYAIYVFTYSQYRTQRSFERIEKTTWSIQY